MRKTRVKRSVRPARRTPVGRPVFRVVGAPAHGTVHRVGRRLRIAVNEGGRQFGWCCQSASPPRFLGPLLRLRGQRGNLAVLRVDDERGALGRDDFLASTGERIVVRALDIGGRAPLQTRVPARRSGRLLFEIRHLFICQKLPAGVLVRPFERRQVIARAPDPLQVGLSPRRAEPGRRIRRGLLRLHSCPDASAHEPRGGAGDDHDTYDDHQSVSHPHLLAP